MIGASLLGFISCGISVIYVLTANGILLVMNVKHYRRNIQKLIFSMFAFELYITSNITKKETKYAEATTVSFKGTWIQLDAIGYLTHLIS